MVTHHPLLWNREGGAVEVPPILSVVWTESSVYPPGLTEPTHRGPYLAPLIVLGPFEVLFKQSRWPAAELLTEDVRRELHLISPRFRPHSRNLRTRRH